MLRLRTYTHFAAALFLAAFAIGCQSSSTGGGGGAPTVEGGGANPLEYIPADSSAAIYVDLAQIVKQPGVKEKLQKAMDEDQEGREMFEALHVDPMKDIKAMAAGGTLPTPTNGEGAGVFALSVKLDLDQAVKLAAEKHSDVTFEATTIGGVKGYKVMKANDDDAFVVSQDGIVLLSNKMEQVEMALKAKSSGKNASNSGFVSKNLGKVNTSSQFWAIADLSAMGGNPMMPDMETKAMALQGNLNGGIDMVFTLSLGDDKQAQQAETQVGGMVKGMLAMQTGQMPALKPLVDGLQIKANGADLVFSLTLTKQAMDDLADAIEEAKNN